MSDIEAIKPYSRLDENPDNHNTDAISVAVPKVLKLMKHANDRLNGIENSEEKFRTLLVEKAKTYVNSKAFRGEEVEGGNLACAQVVTTILKDVGALPKVELSTTATKNALLLKGWTKNNGEPIPGDIVIWKCLKARIVDGEVRPGFPHIGVVISSDSAISNNSRKKMPQEHALGLSQDDGNWYKRGVDIILSPPKNPGIKV